MRRRSLSWSVAPALAAAAVVAGAAGASPALAADGCTNADIRSAQHANLPDCRAYEMVSPVDKAGFSVTADGGNTYVEGNHPRGLTVLQGGNGFAYSAGGAVLDPQSQAGLGIPYRSLRGPEGWTSKPINGPIGPPAPIILAMGKNPAISTDGSRSLLASPAALVDGAWPCTATNFMCSSSNLYLQDNETFERKLITGWGVDNTTPIGAADVADTSDDLGTVLFHSVDRYLPDARPDSLPNLYLWKDTGTPRGELSLVGIDEHGDVLPDGAVAGQGAAPQAMVTSRTLSADGRRIFFSSAGQVYLRQDGATTVRVSRSQRATPDPDGPQEAIYRTAEEARGDAVFFTSGEKLTDDSTAEAGMPSLYRYDVDSARLTDLTAAAGPAGVLGVMGSSEDGRTVYFGASAQLVPGQGVDGDANLYRWHDDGTADGAITFIATIGSVADAEGNLINWGTGLQTIPPPSITPDGRFVGFIANRPLTATDTGDTTQVYRYDAQRDEVVCVSCTTDGSAVTAGAEFRQSGRSDQYRVLSDTGAVAFQTEQSLDPADVNGLRDVYLYTGGRAQLISTGSDPTLSTYLGMSASGDDVFFTTRQRLVEQDIDGLGDVYVARVDGGFRVAPTPAPCREDACQGRPSVGRSAGDPGTSTFVGPGNLAAPKTKTTAKKVTARLSVDGKRRITVRVSAPAAGRIRVTGSRTATVTKTVRKAGSTTFRVKLTAKATRSLRRNGRLKITTKVAFTPKSGKASSATVARTIKETV